MNIISEKDLKEKYENSDMNKNDELLTNPLDLMSSSIKVYTKETELNEDATLANLSQEFTKMAKYVVGQLEVVSILSSYMKVNRIIIKYDNVWAKGKWGKEIKYVNPEKANFEEAKALLMNRVNSMMIVSRSVKGSPLKAFLTYGRDTMNNELGMESKQGFKDKLLGKKPKKEDEIE